MKYAKRFAGKKLKVCFSKKNCWIFDTNPYDRPLPWRQDIRTTCTRAPSQHRIMDVMLMIETFITETSGQRNSAASILARFANGGGIISGETFLKRILVKGSWEPSWNRVGINSGETVLESWHHFIIWTQHLYGLQTKLWISLVACAESEKPSTPLERLWTEIPPWMNFTCRFHDQHNFYNVCITTKSEVASISE